MSFLAPLAFGLAALLPVIIAMYLLRMRRQDVEVSSTLLWERLVRDLEANAPWQKLRRNLLLILQLLMLAALILALARPVQFVPGVSGSALTLVIDTSASMAATDVAPSRLDAARRQARQLVDGLAEDAQVTVIAAGPSAQVLVASSRDLAPVYAALDGLTIQGGESDLTPALELAAAVSARIPGAEIVVLSDGQVTLPDRLALPAAVTYYPIGLGAPNQAITLFNLERDALGGLSAFLQVLALDNEAGTAVARRLTLWQDGTLVYAQDMTLEQGQSQAVVIPGLDGEAQLFVAQLEGADSLALDDRAYAAAQAVQPRPVQVIGPGNRFLQTALNLLPGVDLTAAETPAANNFALTIFDGVLPEADEVLPDGNLLFLAPPASTDFFIRTGSLEQPSLALTDAGSAFLSGVGGLDQVAVLDTAQLELAAGMTPLIVGQTAEGETPLLAVGEVEGRRVAVLAFDLRRSDMPLQLAFPILLSNLIGWLAPGGLELPQAITPGQSLSLFLAPTITTAELGLPDGRSVPLAAVDGQFVINQTAQTGIYTLRWGDGEQARFAVNLFAPRESDLSVAGSLPLSGSQSADGGTQRLSAQDLWPWLASLALAILCIEWLVYHRSVFEKWWRGWRGSTGNRTALNIPARPGRDR